MEQEKKNQYIVVGIIIFLLILVITFIIYSIFINDKKDKNDINVKLNQIYSSDYRLTLLDENYFIGSYSKEQINNRINVIIDNKGNEIVKNIEEITYDNIYKMKNGNYLIYNNINNVLNCYIFDGEKISYYNTYDNVSYVKPLIYIDNKEEYVIGFASIGENVLNIINLDSKEKVVLENKSIIADYNTDGVYYTFSDKYLVVKDIDGLMGIIDFNGKQVIDYQYKNIINAKDDTFIAISKKDKYGIIGIDSKPKVKFNYDVIARFDEYYLFVKDNKMALFDKDYNNVTGFKMNYDSLINYDFRNKVNSISIYKVDNKIVVINNNMELNNGTEFDKHNLYVIEGSNIVENITQTYFNCGEVMYIVDKEKNIIILNNSFDHIVEFKIEDLKKIDNIKIVSNDIYKINYLDDEENKREFYINKKGEKVNFPYGDILIYHENYRVTKNDDNILTLYDNNYEKISEITGNNIVTSGEFIIVDSSIYKVVIS